MRYKIWSGEPEESEPVMLKFILSGKLIYVDAVDHRGNMIHGLLALNERGELYRYSNIPPSLGFRLNSEGQIELTGDAT